MYHIVSFPSTNDRPEEFEVIHERWVLPNRKKCFFPPFMLGQYKKALKSGMKPDATWNTCSMRIIDSYDSYDEAYEWLPIAEVTANLKREKEDVEVENEDVETERNKKRKIEEQNLVDSSGDEQDILVSALPSHNLNLQLPPAVPHLIQLSVLNHSSTDIAELTELVEQHDVHEESSQLFGTLNGKDSTSEASTPVSPQVKVTSFQDKVLRWMAEMDKKIEQQRVMLGNILFHLQVNSSDNNRIIDEEFPKLPVKSLTEFKDLERFIDDTSNFTTLVKYLSKKGGNNVSDMTKRVLKSLIHYNLAAEFNWAGRGEKHPFKDSKIKILIIRAIRESANFPYASEKEIEEQIKSFLKYAPLRVKYANKIMV